MRATWMGISRVNANLRTHAGTPDARPGRALLRGGRLPHRAGSTRAGRHLHGRAPARPRLRYDHRGAACVRRGPGVDASLGVRPGLGPGARRGPGRGLGRDGRLHAGARPVRARLRERDLRRPRPAGSLRAADLPLGGRGRDRGLARRPRGVLAPRVSGARAQAPGGAREAAQAGSGARGARAAMGGAGGEAAAVGSKLEANPCPPPQPSARCAGGGSEPHFAGGGSEAASDRRGCGPHPRHEKAAELRPGLRDLGARRLAHAPPHRRGERGAARPRRGRARGALRALPRRGARAPGERPVKRFTELYTALDSTTKTGEKVAALVAYFSSAPREDAAWALFFLSGRRLTRLLPSAVLVEAALRVAKIPSWLFEASFHEVGDFAETLALVLDTGKRESSTLPLHAWVEERILPLRDADAADQVARLSAYFQELNERELYMLMKILTGEMRVGVSEKLVVRAIAKVAGASEPVIAHRLMGEFQPTAEGFAALLAGGQVAASQPYPFFLASPLDEEPRALGERGEWQAEWKWDGIRAELVKRQGSVFIWSRGEELVTERFPEVVALAASLPDGTVLDGELLAFRDGKALSFGVLQRRIGRKKLSAKLLEEAPVDFMAFDILEHEGRDVRGEPLSARRALLERVASSFPRSEIVAGTWDELARLRETS